MKRNVWQQWIHLFSKEIHSFKVNDVDRIRHFLRYVTSKSLRIYFYSLISYICLILMKLMNYKWIPRLFNLFQINVVYTERATRDVLKQSCSAHKPVNLNKNDPEALSRSCSVKSMFLEVSQNSQENSCARVSFLIKLQVLGLNSLPIKFIWYVEQLLSGCHQTAASNYLYF